MEAIIAWFRRLLFVIPLIAGVTAGLVYQHAQWWWVIALLVYAGVYLTITAILRVMTRQPVQPEAPSAPDLRYVRRSRKDN